MISKEYNCQGHSIEIRNPKESLGMGGPFMGTLVVDGNVVFENVLVDLTCSEAEGKVFFAKYFEETGLLTNKYHFKILIHDIETGTTNCIERKFRSLHIDSYTDNVLHVNLAFHENVFC